MPCRCSEERPAPGHREPALLRGWRWCPAAVLVALLLGACGSPLPPIQLLRLPSEAPAAVASAAPRPDPAVSWQLMAPVHLPGHLDRDALLVPQGRAGVQPLGGARWAEPLRDAAPRLLRQDLARRLGQPLWSAPLPPGVSITHQLRVEIAAFDVGADGRSVSLQARWSVADVRGAVPPRLHEAAFVTAATGADADALAAAHRQALWELAGRIAATAGR
jgi:uncharacterized protein